LTRGAVLLVIVRQKNNWSQNYIHPETNAESLFPFPTFEGVKLLNSSTTSFRPGEIPPPPLYLLQTTGGDDLA
jgi:hypothetical protein